ncbi:MAG: efflux RND transporter periplasmic adaptor subunit [Xanthomonadales bacterium]|jgi:RND family efflux transporter MFP subunit|nr:efflux RND transporter periplasmic adaptor subunit [Xanthomonadales bacterium]
MMKHGTPWTAALLAFAVGLASGALPARAQESGMPPALVRVAEARMQTLAPVTLVPGTVVSRDDARLAAELDGRLVDVAEVGTTVAAGEPVAYIEDTRLVLRHQELRAEIERAQARLEFLEREQQRFARLAESNLAAATQLEQTRSDRDMARSELRVAESRLALNEDQRERTVIRAPFPGTVVERLMMPGERASDGASVVRLVNQRNLEVIARAPLAYYPFVARGQRLALTARETRAEGVVRTVVAVGDEDTHQFELRIDLDEGIFPVGQTVRVAVPMDEMREVLAVPRDALVLRPEGISLFKVDENNLARQVKVTTGIGAGDQIEVNGMLDPGDRVVIRGNERLQPGQPVTITGG